MIVIGNVILPPTRKDEEKCGAEKHHMTPAHRCLPYLHWDKVSHLFSKKKKELCLPCAAKGFSQHL